MKAKNTDTVQLSQHPTDPEAVPVAVKVGLDESSKNLSISRIFSISTAGALLVGIVVLWDQNREQQETLDENSSQIENGMKFSKNLQALAVRNHTARREVTSLIESEMNQSKKANEALAASIRNLSLNLADLGSDLRSDVAYLRQEQDSVFATIDAMSIMTASHNERIESLSREIAETDATDELNELRVELQGVRQEQASAFATIEAISLQTATQDQRLEGLTAEIVDADNSEELDDLRLDLADIRQDFLGQGTEISDLEETLSETRTELVETRNASAVLAISNDQLTKKFAELEEVLTEQILSNTTVDKPISVETPASPISPDPAIEEEDSSDSDEFNFDPEPNNDESGLEEESFDEEEEEYFDGTED